MKVTWWSRLLTYEPALVAWAINGGIAVLVGFIFRLDATQVAAITTITTALASVFTAIKARPVAVSVIGGAFTTIAVACEAFGVHLSAANTATIVTVLSAFLGLLFRTNLTPTHASIRDIPTAPGGRTPTVMWLPSGMMVGYNPDHVTGTGVTPADPGPGIAPDATPGP